MNYIYVDNYRGFSKTLIPIKDVNFLVGENSTGKTSILGLIKLLSPPDFWLKNEFDFRKVGFGTFKDVVSINSKDNSSFSVGLIFDQAVEMQKTGRQKERKKCENPLVALVMTFTEQEGIPKLSSLISFRNGHEVLVKYVGKSIRYKYREVNREIGASEFVKNQFETWIDSYKNDSTGYTILKESKFFLRQAPPIVIISYIEDLIGAGENGGERIQFEISSFFHDIAWLAPIRSKPRKTYDEFSLEFSPEGDHTPYLIKKKLDSKHDSEKFVEFINKVGKNSGLFKGIEIKNYGRGATVPFELDVILGKHPLSVSSVGYGVSQSLPVIVEIFSRAKNSWFAIQQPEVHLHPKAQAALGEAFFDMTTTENKKFVVETHSDYAIDRFRILLRKSKYKIKSQILFFEKSDSGNRVVPIEIDENGDLDSGQPDSYRSFFMKEEMDLLGL
jgi:hypothetical protein